MVLLASEVFRTRATSSASTPRCAATRSRASSMSAPNFARFWKEQSTSTSWVSWVTRSATRRGDGQRLAAFMGTRSSPKENWARTMAQ